MIRIQWEKQVRRVVGLLRNFNLSVGDCKSQFLLSIAYVRVFFFQDSSNLNKKIIFDDDDDIYSNSVDVSTNIPSSQSGNQLFNEDSSEEEGVESFSIKKQFEGEKGKKVSGFKPFLTFHLK